MSSSSIPGSDVTTQRVQSGIQEPPRGWMFRIPHLDDLWRS